MQTYNQIGVLHAEHDRQKNGAGEGAPNYKAETIDKNTTGRWSQGAIHFFL